MMSNRKRWTLETVPKLEISKSIVIDAAVIASADTLVEDQLILRNNAHMPHNDAAFYTWVLRQLYNTERYHMVEPFYIVGNGQPDMRTVYQNLENGGFANAAEFERGLNSVSAGYFEKNKTGTHYSSAQQEKVDDLSLALPDCFKQRNRWEGNRRRNQQQHQHQQQAPAVPSTSASAAASHVAPATTALPAIAASAPTTTALPAIVAPALAQSAAAHASPHSRFNTPLAVRASATPGPSYRPAVLPREAPTEKGHADLDNTSRQASETVDHNSALRQARREKKRAATDEDIGTGSKRARQEVYTHKYRYVVLRSVNRRWRILTNISDLRIRAAEVIIREMRRATTHESDIELRGSARRYVNHLSRMDTDALQDTLQAHSTEICIDYMHEIEELVFRYILERINQVLTREGQSIQQASKCTR
jgi:hypothetical protein